MKLKFKATHQPPPEAEMDAKKEAARNAHLDMIESRAKMFSLEHSIDLTVAKTIYFGINDTFATALQHRNKPLVGHTLFSELLSNSMGYSFNVLAQFCPQFSEDKASKIVEAIAQDLANILEAKLEEHHKNCPECATHDGHGSHEESMPQALDGLLEAILGSLDGRASGVQVLSLPAPKKRVLN